MKKILTYLFGYELMQFKFGRKFLKGDFYYVYVQGLGLVFWTEHFVDCCQSVIVKTEKY